MNLDKNIGWCTHTHNITTGCLNKELGICNVDACYARQTAENPFYRKAFPYLFEPHFYEERIHQIQKLKKPAIIFMDSMSDTFGSWWTNEQILKILHIMDNFRGVHWHKYVDLTKNPARMVEILERYSKTDGNDRLKNTYFGTSVTGLGDSRELDRLSQLHKVHTMGYKTVLSMEPLLHDPYDLFKISGCASWIDWAIVGGQTKPDIFPPYMSKCSVRDWVEADNGVPLFIKDNATAKRCTRLKPDRHRFPADLLPIAKAWGKA